MPDQPPVHDLAELERLLKEATTERPWTYVPQDSKFGRVRFGGEAALNESGSTVSLEDAALIAAAVNALPDLLAVADASKAVLDSSVGAEDEIVWVDEAELLRLRAALRPFYGSGGA